jgi:hypothetical protein
MSGNNTIKADWLPPANLPEGGKWRDFERKALEIRRFAGKSLSDRLDPFELAGSLNLKVVYLKDIEGLSEEARRLLEETDSWSGGSTKQLPDGSHIVIINGRQSLGRQGATLMEEICHTLFGHAPSRISLNPNNQKSAMSAMSGSRTYNETIEEEAYSVGAAALVPYQSLAEMLMHGVSVNKIARHFGVTLSLVEYRMRVLDLWKKSSKF